MVVQILTSLPTEEFSLVLGQSGETFNQITGSKAQTVIFGIILSNITSKM